MKVSTNEMSEPFTGTMPELREFFLRKWAKSFGHESRWEYVGIGLLYGIYVKNIKTNERFGLWSGVSGCNFSMTDEYGGSHSIHYYDTDIYEVVCKPK